jgi:hypothetical protein
VASPQRGSAGTRAIAASGLRAAKQAHNGTMMQFKTAHDKLAFDLWEKRFNVYNAVQNVISAATVHGQVTPEAC